MKRAVTDLAKYPDDRLFTIVSEGIPLIVQNAINLDNAAKCLFEQNHYRVSKIISEFAEEEAAKVLILIDLIRCPVTKRSQRIQTAKHFYRHVSKRIYAKACSLEIESFEDLSDFVQRESRPYYLDGPNYADWIFWNNIAESRNRDLYVDYVQDITEEQGECFWLEPYEIQTPFSYRTPDCVALSHALSQAGAKSVEGVAVIAEMWREFIPGESAGSREFLEERIIETLKNMPGPWTGVTDWVIEHWPFPMWHLEINEHSANAGQDLGKLRIDRVRILKEIAEREAKREPRPAISREKVEKLAVACMKFQLEASDVLLEKIKDKGNDPCYATPLKNAQKLNLPAYTRFMRMFGKLTKEERSALLALAWYARETIPADWPNVYSRAISYLATDKTDHENHQIAQSSYWIQGLKRWESKPKLPIVEIC